MCTRSSLLLVGLDLGGTHIDGVIIDDGLVIKTIKKVVDRGDLFTTIWTALTQLIDGIDNSKIERINLSTTISTNAIVENTIEPVGLILSSGPGVIHDFSHLKGVVHTISGSIDHRGVVVQDLDDIEIYSALETFKANNITDCAVIGKFSTRNVQHELHIEKILENEMKHITVGHRMSGSLNFPRRVYTSYLNAAVISPFEKFATNIKKSLAIEGLEVPLFILKADGGTMDMKSAREHPVETILSGPAASMFGMLSLFTISEDAILLDVGGTTTDIFFLADGVPLFDPDGATISEFKTLVRAVYSVSIGLGGDSVVRVIGNRVTIGPQRKGAPYAYGGPEVTPTDAMICLGLIEEVSIEERTRGEEGLKSISKALGKSLNETATLILNTMAQIIKETTDCLLSSINKKPVYTIKELLYGKRVVPTSLYLIGGPVKILAPYLEKVYQLPSIVPLHYDIGNAIGAALAIPTLEVTLRADTSIGTLSIPEMGLYEHIDHHYTLEQAKERVLSLLKGSARKMILQGAAIECEIVEENSFNMVRGFSTVGKNIRVKGQIKPASFHFVRGGESDES
jgi:N-methylhydantoinase A/oxoprolinase/acetone carboxylase beta subunit